jgi:sensor histidine kinase YesM
MINNYNQNILAKSNAYNFSNWIYLVFFFLGILPALFSIAFLIIRGEIDAYSEGFIIVLLVSVFMSCTVTLIISFFVFAYMKWLQKLFPWERGILKRLVFETIGSFGITMLLMFLLVSVVKRFVPSGFDDSLNLFGNLLIAIVMDTLIVLVIEGIFFFKQWKYSLVEAERFKNESIKSKLESLKTQLNPHFLFNNLNTLSNLIADDNTEAITFVDDFSDVYRYVLTSSKKEVVTISEEIKFINAYINLLKKRHGSSLNVSLSIPKQYYDYRIPPLTLQLLIENAVKHNIVSRSKPLSISVDIIRKGDLNMVEVRNNLQKKTKVAGSTEIGLNNITRRYNYLSDNKIIIKDSGDYFSVKLPLL